MWHQLLFLGVIIIRLDNTGKFLRTLTVVHKYKHILVANVGDAADCAQYGDLRLIGGNSALEGRIEICSKERMWKKVCNDGWGDTDAQVVCRQLGFSQVGKMRKYYGQVIYS